MNKFISTNDYLKSFKFSETSEKQDIVPFKSVFDNIKICKKINDLLDGYDFNDYSKILELLNEIQRLDSVDFFGVVDRDFICFISGIKSSKKDLEFFDRLYNEFGDDVFFCLDNIWSAANKRTDNFQRYFRNIMTLKKFGFNQYYLSHSDLKWTDFGKDSISEILSFLEKNIEVDKEDFLFSNENYYSIGMSFTFIIDDIFGIKGGQDLKNYRNVFYEYSEKESFLKDVYYKRINVKEGDVSELWDRRNDLNFTVIKYLIENKDFIIEEIKEGNIQSFFQVFLEKRDEYENQALSFLNKLFNKKISLEDKKNNKIKNKESNLVIFGEKISEDLLFEFISLPDFIQLEIKKIFFLSKEFKEEKESYYRSEDMRGFYGNGSLIDIIKKTKIINKIDYLFLTEGKQSVKNFLEKINKI